MTSTATATRLHDQFGITLTAENTGGGWLAHVAPLESGFVLVLSDGQGGDDLDAASGSEANATLYTAQGWDEGDDELFTTSLDEHTDWTAAVAGVLAAR